MNIYDLISPTENIQIVTLPALYQGDLGLTTGNIYRLSVDVDVASGVLEIYQGNQLIYSSNVLTVGSINSFYDDINIVDHVSLVIV